MKCPLCGNKKLKSLAKFVSGPVMQNNLSLSFAAAKKEKPAVIDLRGCRTCGFVFNAGFDETSLDYSGDYDNSSDQSAYFHAYISDVAKYLYKKYNLKNRSVLEIGCGKGSFLKALYALGARRLAGFDPTYERTGSPVDKFVTRKFFNGKSFKGKADFIICREVLEHIPEPRPFVRSAIETIQENGVMYFEVPNLDWVVRQKVFFDFTYEHCNYFTKASLFRLFNQFGFGDIAFSEGVGGQYIKAEISQGKSKQKPPARIDLNKVSEFITKEAQKYKKMTKNIGKFAVWGVAGKGVTFLNRLGISHTVSPYAIDINPNKHGRFVPITGQKVVGPSILKKERIDSIIIMNPIYAREIKKEAGRRGYKGKFFLPYGSN